MSGDVRDGRFASSYGGEGDGVRTHAWSCWDEAMSDAAVALVDSTHSLVHWSS
jgi:hypothetical protein